MWKSKILQGHLLDIQQSWESSKYVKEPDSGLEAQTINLTGQDI